MHNLTSPCTVKQTNLTNVVYVGFAISFFILCLNLFKITTIVRTPALHNNTNWFIASVGVSDSIFAASGVIFSLFYLTRLSQLIQVSNTFDAVMLGIFYSSVFSAALHLIIIAIDRHMYILKPFCYIKHMSTKRICILMIFVWGLTLIYLITPSMLYTGDMFHMKCILLYPPKEYFAVLVTAGVPVYFITCVCYFRISRVAFQRKKAKNARRQLQEPSAIGGFVRSNSKAAMKSVKFFMSMYGIFAIFHSPVTIVTIMCMFSYDIPMYIYLINLYLTYVNIALTFFVYIRVNKDFRLAVKNQCLGCLPSTSRDSNSICNH